jgi:imidazolonepropionase-like amidohydrolase
MSSGAATERTLVVRHGTLIDGSGRPPVPNDALVIEGNRIKSVGPLPESIRSSGSRDDVEVIDASGQWIMSGLIDASDGRFPTSPPIASTRAGSSTSTCWASRS